MMLVCNKGMCSACNACVNICPRNCITMERGIPDETTYAVINKNKCIGCGKCKTVCPINYFPRFNTTLACYSGWSLDDEIRKKSASGGVATEIYRYAAKEDSYFAGVTLNTNREAVFSLKSKEGWREFQNSKYVYSDTKYIFSEIVDKLCDGRRVIFIGLPCQVAGLRNYVSFKKVDDSRLLVVDLVCHGVMPTVFLKKHIASIEKKYARAAKDIYFRDPRYLTHSYTFSCSDDKGVFYKKAVHRNDSYQIAYHVGISYRSNCYQCKFSTKDRMGDITLADFGGVGKLAKCDYDNINVSCILINTLAGEKLIKNMNDQGYIYIEKRPIEEEYETEPRLSSPTPVPYERKKFLSLYDQNGDFEYSIQHASTKKIIKNEISHILNINGIKKKIYVFIPKRVKAFLKRNPH